MRGHTSIRYALIGLVPYTFHYDLSRAQVYQYILLQHAIVFNDVHNFFVPVEVYKSFFCKEWLETKLSLEPFDVKNPYRNEAEKLHAKKSMDTKAIEATTNTWNGKCYPATRDENIKILDDYLTLCEENNIRPVMFRVPVTEKYMANFNPQLLDEFNILVEQACRKHPSARFVDGWELEGFTYDDFMIMSI